MSLYIQNQSRCLLEFSTGGGSVLTLNVDRQLCVKDEEIARIVVVRGEVLGDLRKLSWTHCQLARGA